MRSAALTVAAWMACGGCHAVHDHVVELLGVVAVGVDSGVGAEGHLYAGLEGFAEVLALEFAYAALLGGHLFGDAEIFGLAEDVVVVVDVHDEVGAVGLGEADAFVVDEGGVFDGVDAGVDGVLDGLGAVGVGGDLAAGGVGGVGCHLEFFVGVLLGSGLVAFAEDAAGGEDLDDVDAVFDLGADGVADLFGAVGDGEVTLFGEHGDAGLRASSC